MACIFHKMPYVFLSINNQYFSNTIKYLFNGKLPDFCPATFSLYVLNNL